MFEHVSDTVRDGALEGRLQIIVLTVFSSICVSMHGLHR